MRLVVRLTPNLSPAKPPQTGGLLAATGQPFHTVSVSADGKFQFVDADLGALAGKVELEPRTYQAEGWTIAATADAVTFTNDRTGRGMQVSTQSAQTALGPCGDIA